MLDIVRQLQEDPNSLPKIHLPPDPALSHLGGAPEDKVGDVQLT